MIELPGLVKAQLDTRQGGAANDFAGLKPGDRLTAKVLRVETDQRVLMDLGRFRALAHLPEEVATGQTLHLKVVQTGSPLHLQLIHTTTPPDWPPSPQMMLIQGISKDEHREFLTLLGRLVGEETRTFSGTDPAARAVRQAIGLLHRHLEPLALSSATQKVIQKLQEIVRDRGIFFEKKLTDLLGPTARRATPSPTNQAVISPGVADHSGGNGRAISVADQQSLMADLAANDLKPQLQLLRAFFDKAGPDISMALQLSAKQTAFLQRMVHHMGTHLEQQQELLVQRHVQTDQFEVITHWVPLMDQKKPLKLRIFHPRQEAGQDRRLPQKVCLLLDMDRLGPVRADISLMERQLQIAITVVSPAAQQCIEEDLDLVVNILDKLFSHVQINVAISQPKIDRFDDEALMDLEKGRIDLQA